MVKRGFHMYCPTIIYQMTLDIHFMEGSLIINCVSIHDAVPL